MEYPWFTFGWDPVGRKLVFMGVSRDRVGSQHVERLNVLELMRKRGQQRPDNTFEPKHRMSFDMSDPTSWGRFEEWLVRIGLNEEDYDRVMAEMPDVLKQLSETGEVYSPDDEVKP